ncbi:MAG: hypothetical protein RBG13Loki_2697 [Promethearchaeota archaeon CR_4]|nr:MAG: hypothetical protein RBG13Loki_2697 [Candidatus Lokiarchaeota archaeon CR_4]
MPKMYRQGDVLLLQVTRIPRSAKKSESNVVLKGEVTGHAHCIMGGEIFVFNATDTMYVRAREDTTLVHDEHAPIKLEPGKYQVIRQREFDPEHPDYNVWVED